MRILAGGIFIWESIPKNMSNVPQAATQAAFIYAGPAVTHLSAPLFPGAGLFRCGRHGRHGMIGVGFDRDTSRGYQQCDLAPPLPIGGASCSLPAIILVPEQQAANARGAHLGQGDLLTD
jgi:hypothetical protein